MDIELFSFNHAVKCHLLVNCLLQPFARLGAEVTGIDASSELIRVADWHASLDSDVRDRVTYKISSVEELCSSDEPVQLYDGVIASEIVEHVSDAELFVRSCCSLVKVSCLSDQTMLKCCIWSHCR